MLATEHPLYTTYSGMHDRCKRNPRYVSKGITVCARWAVGQHGGGAEGFWNFVADVGERPEGTTLDRKDNNGDYTPENCRWATYKEQTANADLAVGARHGQSRLTADEVRKIKAMLAQGMSSLEVSRATGVKRTTISDIKMRRTWRHLD